ncbi:flagellar hook protein FlgE [Methylomarinovum caldicuralii]|uniref:Flagellar hook protein FlgE n=1 Tax=Methylomarinovum caldicuralii TaxID=438856 RepID=A0AAU9BVB2_9GAMM|nr:flagellar hook protein FlgE [Methylomarinovum caldicuralii]BCX82923.1 flagellar hook protein FlgE [Methylomarinovum caldicuralii]
MSFSTALSGLNAASTDLQTTGNNIANANTVGFKKSRAEFADVYAAGVLGASKTTPGSGVRVTDIAQTFSQGNMEYTENVLDLAINGQGFFGLVDPKNLSAGVPSAYTRNGAFQLNKDGYIVDDQGMMLYGTTPTGNGEQPGALRVDVGKGKPSATTKESISLNLNASASAPVTTPFDPTDTTSYNYSSSITAYDSLGNAHNLTTYFVKDGTTPNKWSVYQYIDGTTDTLTSTPISLEFDTNGSLIKVNGSSSSTKVNLDPFTPTGADPLNIEFDFAGTSQYNSDFTINSMSQDGFPAGDFSGLEVNDKGEIFARFTNGNGEKIGHIKLFRFRNEHGLAKLGNTTWGESSASGPAISSQGDNPGTGNVGTIQSGALEASNVDLSKELVRLIIAQQSYQANAETISTENRVIEALLNVR